MYLLSPFKNRILFIFNCIKFGKFCLFFYGNVFSMNDPTVKVSDLEFFLRNVFSQVIKFINEIMANL